VLQSARQYGFSWKSVGLPPGVQLTLIDTNNHVYTSIDSIPPTLAPGTYWVHIAGVAGLSGGSYNLQITLATTGDNPPPLTTGAAPAVRLSLAPTTPPTPPSGGGPPSPGPSSNPSSPLPTSPTTPVNTVVLLTPVTNTTTTPAVVSSVD